MAETRTTRPDAAAAPPSLFAVQARVAELYRERCAKAFQDCCEATLAANRAWTEALKPVTPAQGFGDAVTYWADFAQRSLLFWDTLRRRGNDWLAHEAAGKPPLLAFPWEIVADARGFARPANYALARILAPDGVATDPDKRPYVIIDPRAGHGPGIGGFKPDSEVGVALRAGHPVYVVIFFPEPVPGQTLADVAQAEAAFLRLVGERHPTRGRPVIVGNCQGGWAAMLVGALDPEQAGPLVINGAPMSYWAGNDAENPMRYAGGLLGGSWPALLASDLGGGVFDGAHLVENFESLNPANTNFGKAYGLFSKIDTEPARFLEFERWWGGYFLMNREEIRWIVDTLFVGNRLAAGRAEWAEGKAFDLRAIRSPIILFASLGDNITPPQQAFNWVADLYPTTADLKANGQVIVGLMHESVGHLGIFVSGNVARREHAQIVDLLDYIEHLPPGLYGMTVEDMPQDAEAGGGPRYDVVLRELEVEDLQRLQKYARKDEVPFEAVRRVSDLNAAAYETFVHPVVSAWVPREAGAALRALHPLRVRRWALSDLNPALSALTPWADLARAHRVHRDEAGLWAAAERRSAAGITAAWDFYRQMRDASAENLFYATYASLSVVLPRVEAPAAATEGTPALREAVARIAEGDFTDAAVRACLLMARLGPKERRLSTLKRIRELVGRDVGLLAMSASDAARVVRRQAAVVEHAPDAAMASLPDLVRTAEERRRLLDVVDRLANRLGLGPEQRALLPRFRDLLGLAPAGVPSDAAAPRKAG
ncbi:DUF3141 domain-containing protein [Methylobacterium nonmethylotrophicum]|uniref:DUF3141 domain-containing protein n=1 Tax=Methylobacterium nonmethylotrophicum TaxID=1141884 RepID=A0A4Z0NPS6_9HYPH|nr:DUF3141 domain-containing protein [Methylobacterium nonmethylotrophicum]TGD98904.1 DUF3141 domain-containing protein [Methylobacterium nonmethylotrophicum]